MLWQKPESTMGNVAEPVRIKSVALPIEHGGWGLLGEPVLLGLLLAPTWAGFGLALAGLGAFLARHPLKLVVADWRARRRVPRTPLAERFALLYAALAIAGLALAMTGRPDFWLPLCAAAPFALVQFGHDALGRSRHLLPELAGSIALSSLGAAVLVAGGWPLAPALVAWLLLSAKSVGAILYVRTRLRAERGAAQSRVAPLGVHAAALALGVSLAATGRAPWLSALAFAVLLARALRGLARSSGKTRPQVVGMQELAYGLGFVLMLALGWALPA
jgi:hypothetical protein